MSNQQNNRVIFLDYLRVIACFMVMMVHSCEPFYLGGQGTLILNETDGMWVTLIDSALRPCVPLFIMASSYLLFPVKGDTTLFYKKRVKRVLIPFLFWVLLYALIPLFSEPYSFYSGEEILCNLKQLAFNFVGSAGHLWFVYMIMGIYIVLPIFSPWIEKVSRRGERIFLILWAFTTLVPFFRLMNESQSGLSEFWGEANWNEFGTLYGVSGFIGYVVLGHYIRTHVKELSWSRTLLISLPLLIVGYVITAGGFWDAMPKSFPVDGPIDIAVRMEATWGFCSTGVMLQTLALFLLIRKCQGSGWCYEHIIRPISAASYGMYLMHIFYLCLFCTLLRNVIPSTLAVILLTAVCTYTASFLTSHVMSKLPLLKRLV